MKISASYLGIRDDFSNNIIKLDNSNIDYIHMDIMDGLFVNNKTMDTKLLYTLLKNTNKPKDIHLMVNNIKEYVDNYMIFNPTFITIHLEASVNIMDDINYIKSKNVGVGLSIKPNTNISDLYPFLPYIDQVLIMSVEPGYGGQEFIPTTIDKINKLVKYREENDLGFIISVDGGINERNIRNINSDMVVVGTFITNNTNYNEQIEKLKI